MPFQEINTATPAGTDKKKFGDDVIREFKEQTAVNFREVSNYPATAAPALRTAVWTTATRPSGAELVDRVTGYNTDLGCEEYYDLANTSWKAIYNNITVTWTCSSRPSGVPTGYTGFNTDLWVTEMWNGSAWKRLSGGNRGDKKDWIGPYADAETTNPGWVLCDGVQRTHPEGGNFTPPNLRDRFIVGAGSSYAVGATGGANTVTLDISTMPSHQHVMFFNGSYTRNPWGTTPAGSISSDEGYRNSLNPLNNTSFVGGGAPHENRPPYYAVCFLYKI